MKEGRSEGKKVKGVKKGRTEGGKEGRKLVFNSQPTMAVISA